MHTLAKALILGGSSAITFLFFFFLSTRGDGSTVSSESVFFSSGGIMTASAFILFFLYFLSFDEKIKKIGMGMMAGIFILAILSSDFFTSVVHSVKKAERCSLGDCARRIDGILLVQNGEINIEVGQKYIRWIDGSVTLTIPKKYCPMYTNPENFTTQSSGNGSIFRLISKGSGPKLTTIEVIPPSDSRCG